MQYQQTEQNGWSGFNRWTFTSLATALLLTFCSVGCVSWEHNLRKHSVFAKIAKKNQGRYYHCPHCGQIILQDSNRCPGCHKIPAYHGYEATCWRTFPEGWGCLPETVANNPAFFPGGMLEAPVEAMPIELTPASPSDQTRNNDEEDSDGEDSDDEMNLEDEKAVDKPSQGDAVDADVENVAPPIPDAEPNSSEVRISQLPQTTLARVEEAPVKTSESVLVESEVTDHITSAISSKEVAVAQPQPAKPETVVVEEAKPSSKQSAAKTIPPVEVKSEPKTTPQPKVAAKPLVEPQVVVQAPAKILTPKPVLKKVAPVAPKESVAAKPRTKPVVKTVSTPQVTKRTAELLPAPRVSRVPVPVPQIVVEPQVTKPVASKQQPKEEPEARSVLQAEQERKVEIKPQDEFGPIPVRKVRLTGANEVLPKPTAKSNLHPAPVRRISLSELPVTIE